MIIRPTILSGGAGTRLWPLSRQLQPKQFWGLTSQNSMFQNTLNRVQGLSKSGLPLIISNVNHRFQVQQQLQSLKQDSSPVILEPLAKNTAPALTAAALLLASQSEEQMMLVMAADHEIKDIDAFQQSAMKAINLARQGLIVTFGIVPTYPETGYGYIQSGENNRVEKFVEKPDLELAKEYIENGNFLWNSGMFVVEPNIWLGEIEKYSPEILIHCRKALDNAKVEANHYLLNEDAFEKCPSDSIDYAVMEHSDKVAVVSLNAGWSDVGSWLSLWQVNEQDKDGNVLDGEVIAVDTSDSYIKSNQRLTAVVGLDDIVVMDTPDALLVLNKKKSQQVKAVVEQLKAKQHSSFSSHTKQLLDWGSLELLNQQSTHKIREIHVSSDAHYIPEIELMNHYIVLSGQVKVNGIMYQKGEHFLIKKEKNKGLANQSDQELKLIEINLES